MNHVDKNSEVIAYLDRIGYKGPLDTSIDTLARLQECHLQTVPYENLDILRRVPISLEIPDLFHKIVVCRRGGYCFELNALFSWLLRRLGFSVTDFFARFWRDEANTPPKRRHHVSQVEAEGKLFLCDVGVGGIIPRRPLQMVDQLVQEQGDECYQLKRDADYGWMLYERKRGTWEKVYSFTEEPQLAKDYMMASYWCENAPDSIFIQDEMVAIHTLGGRKSIAGKEFRIFTAEDVRVFTPQTQEAHDEALKVHFGIVIE